MIRVIGAIVAVLLAVAGGVVLYFYVQGADKRAADGAEFQKVYIVKADVPEGTPGESIGDFLEVDELPAIAIQPDIVTDLSTLEGLVTNAALVPGEQLITARFSDPQDLLANGEVELPAGTQEVTVPLSVSRVVGGVVKPGDTVGIVYSTNTDTRLKDTSVAVTQFIYHRVLVTRVAPGSTILPTDSTDNADTQPVDTIMVTLAVTTPQVEKIVYGAEQQEDGYGGIWLTLEPESADQGGSISRDGGNIYQ